MNTVVAAATKRKHQTSISRRVVAIVAVLFIVLPAVYGLRMWFDPREVWLHPELFATSKYIWALPHETVFQRLAHAVDWKAFDPNVNRVRPLNDTAETVDAVARPYVTDLIGPHPSMTPIAWLTAILAPCFLFLALRRAGLSFIAAAALVGLFLASTGFLSVIIAYIRPAKKLTLVFTAVCLYLALRHAQSRSTGSFISLMIVMFLSFFADEMDLAKFPIVGLIFFRSLLGTAPTWKRVTFISLPVLFLVTTEWGIPALYTAYSIHGGSWDALADSKKYTVFGHLANPYFYVASLAHVGDAFLTTIGIPVHRIATEMLALAVLVGAPIAAIVWRAGSSSTRYAFTTTSVGYIAAGFYATLLDWYPFPDEISYLGSFTYYYHSSLGILVVLWLAFAWLTALEATAQRAQAHRAVLVGGVVACAFATVSNFAMFHEVNRLVQYIHTYPYREATIYGLVRSNADALRRSAETGEAVPIHVPKERERLAAEYEQTGERVFGSRWRETNYYRYFEGFKIEPLTRDDNIWPVFHAHFPLTHFKVTIDD